MRFVSLTANPLKHWRGLLFEVPRPLGAGLGLFLSVACWCWLLIFLGCGSSSLDRVRQKLATVNQKIDEIEARSVNNAEARDLILEARERLNLIEGFLLEDDVAQADKILDELIARVETYDPRKVQDYGKPIRIFGEVTYAKKGESRFREVTGSEKISEIGKIRTGVRSGIAINSDEFVLLLSPLTEIQFAASNHVMLVEGVLNWTQKTNKPYTLQMGEVVNRAERKVSLEMANQLLTNFRYIAVYEGRIEWADGKDQGMIETWTGFRWAEGERKRVFLPSVPVLTTPKSGEIFYSGDSKTGDLRFLWSSRKTAPAYQLQISDHTLFITRVFDQSNLVETEATVTLEPGQYFWRVRGVSGDRIPGPFSRTEVFYVKKGEPEDSTVDQTTKKERISKAGPAIYGLKIEVISDMAIVTGRTVDGARVTVNEVSAAVMQGGKFKAIINFLKGGTQKVRVIAVIDDTGAETILERDVNIVMH